MAEMQPGFTLAFSVSHRNINRAPNPRQEAERRCCVGGEPHGCGEIPMAAPLNGPGMALVSRPPEQHRREGS